MAHETWILKNFTIFISILLELVKILNLNEETLKKLANCISDTQRKNPVKPQKTQKLVTGDT